MTQRRPSCLIFNRDFPVLGGGERYTVALGAVIAERYDVLNLGSLRPARQLNEEWAIAAQADVVRAVDVLTRGCDNGREPKPNTQPSPRLSPQITVELLQDLLRTGALTPRFSLPPTREIERNICGSD